MGLLKPFFSNKINNNKAAEQGCQQDNIPEGMAKPIEWQPIILKVHAIG